MTDDTTGDDFTLVHRRAERPGFEGATVTVQGIAMDRRQCLAACILLSAVDLPQPADKVAQLWLNAAHACPGVTTAEVDLGAGRLAQLQQVRRLVEAMISDCPDPAQGAAT